MTRVTYRQTKCDLADLETLVDADVYANRSEAIRAAVRQFVRDHDIEAYETQLAADANQEGDDSEY